MVLTASLLEDGSAHGGNGFRRGRGSALLAVPPAASKSYRWLEDAITEWQTSQGHLMMSGEAGVGGYTPQQVQEVKLVLRLLPVFFSTIFYWCAGGAEPACVWGSGVLRAGQLGLLSPRVSGVRGSCALGSLVC